MEKTKNEKRIKGERGAMKSSDYYEAGEDMSTRAYWDQKNRKMDEEAKAAKAFAQSEEGQIEALDRKIRGLIAARTDSGLLPEQETELKELEAELSKKYRDQEEKKEAAVRTEWSLETTNRRRAEWNTMVRSGVFHRNGKIWYPTLRAKEEEQGWRHEELAKAVKMHGL